MFKAILDVATPLYQRSKSKISESKIKKALDSLDDARDDIKASKLLCEAEIYSRSVSSLQQSIEKACKAFGLSLGIIKRPKSVGHVSPAVFLKLLEENFSMEYFLPLLERYTKEDQKVKIEKAKKVIFSKKSNLLLLKEEELQSYILFIESMSGQGAQKLKAELNRVQESLNIFMPQIEIKIDLIVDFILCITSLYVLAVITFPHTETSRYSDTQALQPKDYTKDMPLVKSLPKIQAITESAIESLDKFIRNIKLK